MRQESMRTWPIVGQCPARPSKQVGSVRVPLVSRQAVGLLAVGCLVLAWFLEATSVRQGPAPWVVRGEPGNQNWSFVLSPDGNQMAVIDTKGHLGLRDAESGWAMERNLPCSGYARAVAFSADGRFLACGGLWSGATLYDLESKAAARTLAVPVDEVTALAFAPDGRTVAVVAERNAQIILWDLTAARVRRKLHAPYSVQSITFAPDGRHLASGGHDRTSSIDLWDLDTGLARSFFTEEHGPVRVLTFSPDGHLLAAATAWERCVRIWDVASAELTRVLEGHSWVTNSVAFSADGLTLATAGNDGTVRLWDVASGREQAVLDGGAPSLGPVAFASGGECLVATSWNDHDIRVWNLAELGRRAIPGHPAELAPASQASAIRGDPQIRFRPILTQKSRQRECNLGGE
jgi:WD40 repeat protein